MLDDGDGLVGWEVVNPFVNAGRPHAPNECGLSFQMLLHLSMGQGITQVSMQFYTFSRQFKELNLNQFLCHTRTKLASVLGI